MKIAMFLRKTLRLELQYLDLGGIISWCGELEERRFVRTGVSRPVKSSRNTQRMGGRAV